MARDYIRAAKSHLPFITERASTMEKISAAHGMRDGIPIEKGVTLNEEYLNKYFNEIGDLLSIFTAYPDIFLDAIKPEDSNFQLHFFQRIVMRAVMRYQNVYLTASRGFSKSFLTILTMFLQCIFMPGTNRFICAPVKKQGAQIAKQKIYEIYDRWPMLRREVQGWQYDDKPGNFGNDYVKNYMTYALVTG